jgi:UDP-N-acetylmuramate dehydrogenase
MPLPDVTTLSDLTTLRVGGPAARLLSPTTADDLVAAALDAWGTGEEWFVLGGGSNVVVDDGGFDGSVIRTLTRGITLTGGPETSAPDDAGRVLVTVQAGEPWDALVAYTVEQGLAGIEALSGIPGSSGAAPIQNIGAYGQEIGDTLVAVDFVDHSSGQRLRLTAEELELGYRTSVLKQGRRGLVVAIELLLTDGGGMSDPIRYPQLATALGVSLGDRLPLSRVRDAVLALRASKGMLLDPADPDSVSAGSFFTNPIVSTDFARGLPRDAPRWPVDDGPAAEPIVLPLDADIPHREFATVTRVKLSAAWLIENSGIARGFRLPGSRAAISSKHSLAIVNTGGATSAQIAELARYIQTRVLTESGVILQPEPVFVGTDL